LATAIIAKAAPKANNKRHRQDNGETVTTVNAKETFTEGGTEDDFHEDSDVEQIEEESETKRLVNKENSYQLKQDEKLESVFDVDNKVPVKTETKVETVTYIGEDGKVHEKQVTRTYNIYETVKVKRVKKFWTETLNLKSVRDVIVEYVKNQAPELSDEELKLFNTIAYTDGIKFESRYNYFQVKEDDLSLELFSSALEIYKTKLSQEEIAKFLQRIKACDDNFILEVINEKEAEVFSSSAWTVVVQIFAATCGKEIPALQIMAWVASKSGSYKPGQYSESNAATVDRIISKFLLANLGLLFTCKDVPAIAASESKLEQALKNFRKAEELGSS
jgi:succinate dehydrogenase flavin-adding protein (antitoxin of CptAB toxin-antitoxin module)